jgi:uncharacterized membrane protein
MSCNCNDCKKGRETVIFASERKIEPLELAYEPDVAPWRKNLSRRIVARFVGFLRFMAYRWLAVLNLINFALVGLAFAAPFSGSLGWKWISAPVMALCGLICVQDPAHSFFLDGHQMALCQRCLAIYAMFGLAGLFFGLVRRHLKPLKLWQYGLLALPMVLDGFTQLIGWRQSSWELRFLTGGLFGLSTVWWIYPQIERGMRSLKERLKLRFAEAGV